MSTPYGRDALFEKCFFQAQWLIEKGYVTQKNLMQFAEELYKIEKKKDSDDRNSKDIKK